MKIKKNKEKREKKESSSWKYKEPVEMFYRKTTAQQKI